MTEPPIVVHLPADWRKLRKLITAAREITGFVPKYKAKCSGRKVDLPPATVVRELHDGRPYFVCGPDPRYYERCPGCFSDHLSL